MKIAEKLKAYMVREELSKQDVADYFEISLVSVYNILSGNLPGKRLCHKIFIATKGELDFNPENEEKKVPRKSQLVRHKRKE